MNAETALKTCKFKLGLLAEIAKPIDDDDWGSERQIAAENRFHDFVQSCFPSAWTWELEQWCLKATTEEMLDEVLASVNNVY